MTLFWIALFGVLGVFGRYAVVLSSERLFSDSFPFGTLTVNLVGSFLAGILYGIGHERIPVELRTGLFVGFLGGFTTFSTYSLEAFQLLADGTGGGISLRGAGYLLLSPALGLACAALGVLAARSWIQS